MMDQRALKKEALRNKVENMGCGSLFVVLTFIASLYIVPVVITVLLCGLGLKWLGVI